MLPNPETISPSVQKSVLCPGENAFEVSGAYANQPTSGALPAPYNPTPPTKLKYSSSAAERRHPEAERIQPRKRHVARADHQRHEVIRESEKDRHRHEENHRGAVHREHAVENLRRNECAVRLHQLNAHDRPLRFRQSPGTAAHSRYKGCRVACDRPLLPTRANARRGTRS